MHRSLPSLRSELLLQEIDGEMIILDPTHDTYFGVNEVGALILEGIREQYSINEIIESVLNEFEIDKIDAQHDIDAFIQELISNGILVDA